MRQADGRAEVTLLKMGALMAAQIGIIACGQSAPTTPSSIPSTSSSTAAAPSATLAVEGIDVAINRVGSALIGIPVLHLRETGNLSTANVIRIAFTVDGRPSGGVGSPTPPWIVPAGGVLNLPPHPVEVPLGTGTTPTVSAEVIYQDASGHEASTRGDVTLSLPAQSPAADVRLTAAATTSQAAGVRNHEYALTMTMSEAGGVRGFSLICFHFELIGSGQLVPPDYERPLHVDAGGSLTLDDYDAPGITSSALVSQIRIVMSYVDDAGVPGSVEAIAPVTSAP